MLIILGLIGAFLIFSLLTKGHGDAEVSAAPAATVSPVAPNSVKSSGDLFLDYGRLMAERAIRERSENPSSVQFGEKIFENEYPGTQRYVCKVMMIWKSADGENYTTNAVASVHFKGGDVRNSKNWEVDRVTFQRPE